jgi:hypothetical protein
MASRCEWLSLSPTNGGVSRTLGLKILRVQGKGAELSPEMGQADRWASVDHGLNGVITQRVPTHKLHAILANLKRLVREKLSLTVPMGLLAFYLASGIEK